MEFREVGLARDFEKHVVHLTIRMVMNRLGRALKKLTIVIQRWSLACRELHRREAIEHQSTAPSILLEENTLAANPTTPLL